MFTYATRRFYRISIFIPQYLGRWSSFRLTIEYYGVPQINIDYIFRRDYKARRRMYVQVEPGSVLLIAIWGSVEEHHLTFVPKSQCKINLNGSYSRAKQVVSVITIPDPILVCRSGWAMPHRMASQLELWTHDLHNLDRCVWDNFHTICRLGCPGPK